MSLREAKKQRARQDILAAARELIDADGYEQTTMRDIAAAAELSYQTLYNYFPTKALILQALLLEDVNHVAEAMDALVAEHAAGRRPLLPTLHAMFREDLDAVSQRDRESWRVVAMVTGIDGVPAAADAASAPAAARRCGSNRSSIRKS